MPRHEPDEQVLGAAALGVDAHRQRRRRPLCRRSARQAGVGADHRRDELVEREDRRGRKSGQDHDGLAVGDREADRLARLQRDAVRDDRRDCAAGSRCDTTGRRRPWTCRPRRSRRRSRSAARERVGERRVVVGNDAELHRLAAELLHRGADDRRVRVVDRAGPQRLRRARRSRCRSRRSRRAAGDRRAPRATPDRREHADLARGQQLPGAQARSRRARCRCRRS